MRSTSQKLSFMNRKDLKMNTNACTFIGSELSKFSFGYDFSAPKCIALKLQLAQYINDMYKAGIREFYSICQEGVELWAAEIIVYLMAGDKSVKLNCILPYEEQAAKWHPDTQELYYNILSLASNCEIIDTRLKKYSLAMARYKALEKSRHVFAVVEDGAANEYVKYAVANGKKVCVL